MAQYQPPKLQPLLSFQLDADIDKSAVYTTGDPIRGHVRVSPGSDETLSISALKVHFRGEVETCIVTGGGNARHVNRGSVYLFSYTANIQISQISIGSAQTWPFSFAFPHEVLPHPSQRHFRESDLFHYKPGHRLPPSWVRVAQGNPQTVKYYLEADVVRHGRMKDHSEKKVILFRFSPPLDIPDPQPAMKQGRPSLFVRQSHLLDPERHDEHHGLRARTKNFFSHNDDPKAAFRASVSAPTVLCAGDSLPLKLHLDYSSEESTATTPPEVEIVSLHIRLNDYCKYRVPTSMSNKRDFVQGSGDKSDVLQHELKQPALAYDGMRLNEVVGLIALPRKASCTFTTFSINRTFALEVTGVLRCAGKDFDLLLFRHILTIHPLRKSYRPPAPPQAARPATIPLAVAVPDPSEPLIRPGLAGSSEPRTRPGGSNEEETLPPYEAGPSNAAAHPPSYDMDIKS